MSSQNNRLELRLATAEDGPDILEIFHENAFDGNICVQFSRAPDPLLSFARESRQVTAVVLKDHESGELAGVGCCVLRPAYINGEEYTTAYLTGMKLREKYRKWANCIRGSFELIENETGNALPIYYTTILDSNPAVSKMMEKPRKDMPAYQYHGQYTVHFLGAGRRGRVRGDLLFSRDNMNGLDDFYEAQLPLYQFAPTFASVQRIGDDQCYYSLRTKEGEIIAACVVWDQRSYKQYRVTHYKGIYRLLSKLPLSMLGFPTMPKPGKDVNYASIGLLCVKPRYEHVAKDFINQVAQDSRSYDFLMLGLYENHPLLPFVQRMRTYRYSSRFYTVQFDGHPQHWLDDRPLMVEVALL